uniref:Putative secreted protein n=1 Tax=Anopheles marajoara TaxID=58244 RepID=A0A2M4CFC6_9DIPT
MRKRTGRRGVLHFVDVAWILLFLRFTSSVRPRAHVVNPFIVFCIFFDAVDHGYEVDILLPQEKNAES